MCGPGQADAPPATAGQALRVMHEAMTFLASADMTGLTVAEQAECLRGLERVESVRIAAQASALAAFDAKQGYADDGHGSSRTWLRWKARITSQAASAAVAWRRRLAEHPAVRDALARGEISASWARQICDWTDLLPASARQDADDILLAAAAAGAGLQDLAGLAEEMRTRTAGPDSGGDDDGAGRSLRLDLHYRGAGRLRGDMTPRCAAALREVLEALGKKKGPEDTRNREQRYHDALEEACTRLIAARNLPQRAGQPTQIQLLMTLNQLFDQRMGNGILARPRAGPAAGPAVSCHPGGCGRTLVTRCGGCSLPARTSPATSRVAAQGQARWPRSATYATPRSCPS
ncbi:MAG TPA: DUF222 domain-containing protein [Streptosporangiaceae bacterium]|nr:DUF222 domain-containing protein [Streptosporangiaceae bacterium]